MKVAKVFVNFQFLLTKLVVSRCYNFMESVIAEHKRQSSGPGDLEVPSKVAEMANKTAIEQKGTVALIGPTDNMVREEKSFIAGPLQSVKAARSFTGKVVGMPLQATRFAADLSWNVVSKVSRSLIPRHIATSDTGSKPSTLDLKNKREFVQSLLKAKEASGRTFSQIAEACEITNVYCAQLFHNQAQLHPGHTAEMLKQVVPELTDEQIVEMYKAPTRMYDPHLLQEPIVCRLTEVVCHYGESIKALINEECGDGTMSSVDFYMTLDKVKDSMDQDRIMISFNGKFEPHTEQKTENNITLI